MMLGNIQKGATQNICKYTNAYLRTNQNKVRACNYHTGLFKKQAMYQTLDWDQSNHLSFKLKNGYPSVIYFVILILA